MGRGHVSLDDPSAVAGLLRALREAGAEDAVPALADRAAGQASLDDPLAVASLLERCARPGPATPSLPAGPRSCRPGQPRPPRGPSPELLRRAARGRGRGRGHCAWPAGPPTRPASTTWSRRLAAVGAADRPGPTTRPLPWPAGPAAQASLDDPRGRRRAAGGAARGQGRRRGHCPGRPATRRPRQPRRPCAVACCSRRCARPGPMTRSLRWPAGPPPGRPRRPAGHRQTAERAA